MTNGFAPEGQPVEGVTDVSCTPHYDGDGIHLGIDPATVSGAQRQSAPVIDWTMLYRRNERDKKAR